MLKNCAVCGKGFEATSSTNTCGKECRDKHKSEWFAAYYAKNKRLNNKVIPCVICGKEFEANGHGKGRLKVCSVKCRKRLNAIISQRSKLRRKPAPVLIQCKICGQEFYKSGNKKLTCDDECRNENHRRWMIYYSSHPEIRARWNSKSVETMRDYARLYARKNRQMQHKEAMQRSLNYLTSSGAKEHELAKG